MAYLAPALRQLKYEINQRWPNRSLTYDGWIGDKAHQNRRSDHNPDERGVVSAIDVTAKGIDPLWLIGQLVKDRRVNYIIFNRVIWNDDVNYNPRPYNGSNPHRYHIHISVKQASYVEDNASSWGVYDGVVMSDHEDYLYPKKGDESERVKELQRRILEVNPNSLPKYGADGDYGDETVAALAKLGPDYDGTYTTSWVWNKLDRLARRKYAADAVGSVDVRELTEDVKKQILAQLREALG